MSRTTRRKGICYRGTHNSFAHESEKDAKRSARWAEFWEQETGRVVVYTEREQRWNDVRIRERKFHSDGSKPWRTIPGWFRRVYYYAPERAAMRNAIQHAVRLEDWEDIDVVSYVDFHPDLAWNWW